MADEDDKEKAEKLAAAKKRFEELKKQKQKQATKKGGAKKKDEKVDDSAAATKGDASAVNTEEGDNEEVTSKPVPKAETNGTEDSAEDQSEDAARAKPTRTPSLSLQSRQRSESFRKGNATSGGLKSPTLPSVDSEGEAQEIYRKQAARIAELESEIEELKETQSKLQRAEEELEQLRESSADSATLQAKVDAANEQAKELEKVKSDLASTQRQLTQAQQQAATKNRRQSTANGPNDLSAQLASKTSTIESLELELSNLRYQVSLFESEKSGHESNLTKAQERATEAETKVTTLEAEIQSLKESATSSAPTGTAPADGETDPTILQTRISTLESSLKTAQANADAASNKATNLESKLETITKLHRESSTQNAAREKETRDLKTRLKHAQTARADAAGEDLSDLEDEEREKLQSRIRDLEAENFELRRGVWRDARTRMQPGMESPGLEDVDLSSAAATPYGGRPSFGAGGAAGRQSSTFSDVLQSGISAFTGRDNPRSAVEGGRKASLGLLSEEGFDEDAFRQAQEAEVKARIERVREVKRGLEQWRGWRLDLVEARSAGLPGVVTGPVFEV